MSKTILVEGLGRCGSSLMMQILAKAGIKCAGLYPSYEDTGVLEPVKELRDGFYRGFGAGAIKCVDPHRFPPPSNMEAVVIWMDRNPREQAKSALKLMSYLAPGQVNLSRGMLRLLARSFVEDRSIAQKAGLVRSAPVIEITFEELIEHPLTTVRRVGQFLTAWYPLADFERGSSVVMNRKSECHPQLLELAMVSPQFHHHIEAGSGGDNSFDNG